MKDLKKIINKVRDEIGKLTGYTKEDRDRWMDDFLENNEVIIDDETLDRIAKEANRNVDDLKDLIDDMQYW